MTPNPGKKGTRSQKEARKRHININFWSGCSWDDPPEMSRGQTQVFSLFYTMKAQLSQSQTQFVPGTIPGTKGGSRSLCVKSLCAFFARSRKKSGGALGDRESPKCRFPQKKADFRRFTPSAGNSSIWSAQETAENRRFSQKTEDFPQKAEDCRRKAQETTDSAPSPLARP